jgi:hypothetical protein
VSAVDAVRIQPTGQQSLLSAGVTAQFGGQVKVSNVIEGGVGGVGGVSTARCDSTVVVGFAENFGGIWHKFVRLHVRSVI